MSTPSSLTTTAPTLPPPSARRESALPFWCLVFFTFVLFLAPQIQFRELEPLKLAKLSAGLAIASYVLNRLSSGRPLTILFPEVRLMLWFVVIAALSIPYSSWPGGSWDVLSSALLKSVAIFLLIANLVNTGRRMAILIGSIVLWGVVISVLPIQDFAAGYLPVEGSRISGYDSPLAKNPNDLAMTLNMILGLAVGLFLATRSLIGRFFLLGGMGLFATGVVVSYSRAGFLGLAVIVLACVGRLARKSLFPVMALALVLLAFTAMMLPEGYGDRISSVYGSVYDLQADVTGTAAARWEHMKHAVIVMMRNPFGVGLGMNVLGLQEVGMSTWINVHNVFLQIGAELGIPGLIVFSLLVIRLWMGLVRSLNALKELPHARPLRGLGYGVQISLLSFLVTGMFAPVPYHYYFYYIAGFGVAFQVIAQQKVAEAQSEQPVGSRQLAAGS